MQKEKVGTVHCSLNLRRENEELHSEAVLLSKVKPEYDYLGTARPTRRALLGQTWSLWSLCLHRPLLIPQAAVRPPPATLGKGVMFVADSRFKKGQRKHSAYFAM